MHRIDENTLIDKSLITCAEYQLFIDETRTQGKYFQPDHWSSFQFLAGQSQPSIVGIRPSDAKAFCVWLTQRETGVWCYRIPTSAEAADYPLSPSGLSPLGYWTAGINEEPEFAWVGSAPTNLRSIELRTINPKLARDRTIVRALVSTSYLNIDRNLERAQNLAGGHAKCGCPRQRHRLRPRSRQ